MRGKISPVVVTPNPAAVTPGPSQAHILVRMSDTASSAFVVPASSYVDFSVFLRCLLSSDELRQPSWFLAYNALTAARFLAGCRKVVDALSSVLPLGP